MQQGFSVEKGIEHVYDGGMCGGLTEAIEDLSIVVDGDELVAALALRDQLDPKLAAAAAAFDDARLWEVEGATSLIAWLRYRAGLSSRDSAQLAGRVRLLRQLPVTARAFVDVLLCYRP